MLTVIATIILLWLIVSVTNHFDERIDELLAKIDELKKD